ncbi:hypothetical protein ACG83_22065 [Frankia sp. R43]|uniref:NmrA family NAD(P)-binding protein n=1 Tax=Frankia sp. R43 TaxID=269536 RepID=UPI0006C9FD44|nr:NmrA family NAD(P)-binding protein [Frankia sp. R43]KPM53406.1 hypothetical protein ACG83_22065 [Frankia sp. R43]
MILVTGASGALGTLVLDRLRATAGSENGSTNGGRNGGEAGTAADVAEAASTNGVIAGTRTPHGNARHLDFDQPDTLTDGFAGVDVLVFVSAGYAEDDVVLARHGAVVAAATAAGVRHVIYTSLAGSGERMTIALAHRWTETRLADAPFDVTVLRNGLYSELAAGMLAPKAKNAVHTGVLTMPWGTGRLATVAREDLAEAAARVAAETDADLRAGRRGRHAGRSYELEGMTALSGGDLAALLAEESGRPVRYQVAPLSTARDGLEAAGLPGYQLMHSMSAFANINAGFLDLHPSDLPQLLDAAPREARDVVRVLLRAELG